MSDRSPEEIGVIKLAEGRLIFKSLDYGSWNIELANIVVVGEYTTEDGPLIEDHFVVFLLKDGTEFECPVTCHGIRDVVEPVGQFMLTAISFELTLSTDFASRVVAPISLRGQPFYDFRVSKQSLIKKLFRGEQVERAFSTHVKAVLNRPEEPQGSEM